MRSSKLAIFPLLLAERDREFLKQCRRNRDEETELMKNVPGWVVGTYFGEPIYKTKPKDYLHEGTWDEFNVHATNWNRWKRNEHHNFN
jgi:NADH dehydrogenase (ubiquinone) 1 alpha subcomplex subunit 13